MNPNTQRLQSIGQSLWLDNITREMLANGGLARYIADWSVTGLTSNPTIFERAIGGGNFYDAAIAGASAQSGATPSASRTSDEQLFFQLAREDLVRAADLLKPAHDASGGVDGWVSLEVSPLLVDDSDNTILAAKRQYAAAARPNLFIKVPGTSAGLVAIEELIFAGVPINITLLFSCEHYLATAEAYMRGLERRVSADLNPIVESVASLFVSRWDVAANAKTSLATHNRLGIAIARRAYRAYRELLGSSRWLNLARAGAHPQRLLWASTGTKDPNAADTMYVEALAAPDTINTIPEATLRAFADHGKTGALMPLDGGDAEDVIASFRAQGIDDRALAIQLQREGADAFAKSWQTLMACIAQKRAGR